jgi:hypothetical protein
VVTFPSGFDHHHDLVLARVKITPYNPAAAGSAPFFRALVVYSYQVYSVKSADAVIQSAVLNKS